MLNKKTVITIDSHISLKADYLPDSVIRVLQQRLIFTNPLWEEKERRGYSTWDTPETLCYIHNEGDSLTMPRGFIGQLISILKYNGVPFEIIDRTRKLPDQAFNFTGYLYPFQEEASKAILSKRTGVLAAPTGSGKTVIALNIIAQRKQPTLVIVHTKELLHQWRDRAIEFLELSEEEIGLIGDGNKAIGRARGRSAAADKPLTIAIINSLRNCIDEVKEHTGFLIVDECHRTPARVFTEAVKAFDCRYMLGLSATPYRRDKLTRLIYFHMGDKVHSIEPEALQEMKMIMTASLKVTETSFDYDYCDDYQDMLTALTDDWERNTLIVRDVINQSYTDAGITLVISGRKSHCAALYEMITDKGIDTRLLTGETSGSERKTIVDELGRSGKVKVLVATAQLIGEGFDLKALSSIVIATPVKYKGRVKQYIGRILRTAPDKDKAIIYDYYDKPGVLRASLKSRFCAYKDLGVKLPVCVQRTGRPVCVQRTGRKVLSGAEPIRQAEQLKDWLGESGFDFDFEMPGFDDIESLNYEN